MIRYQFEDESIHTEEIHPEAVFTREKQLANAFVKSQLQGNLSKNCPFTGEELGETFFEVWGQAYALASKTWSLSLKLRPDVETLRKYNHESELARYRASKEYQMTLAKKRDSLWTAQIDWLHSRIHRYLAKNQVELADWGARSVGWVENLERAPFVKNFQMLHPLPPFEEPQAKGLFEVITLFDVLQRSADPLTLLKEVGEHLLDDGILVLTCRSGCGFDILSLGAANQSIFPLDHISLPSPEGLEFILEKSGYEVLECSTPGLLDVDYVVEQKDHLPAGALWQQYLVEKKTSSVHDRFQSFLQQNNLSSHMRVVAKKVKR